ncbi:MAG TPA: septum formation initiator family protein [Tissierellaceae bacterium]|jgi:cell division protein FtsB|nr:septum formation initiator family protein [Clostridiaceae bacterium]
MQKRKKLNVVLLVIMSGLLVYFAITFSKQQEEINMIENQMKVLKDRIEKEKAVQEELLEQQNIIETDEFIEKIAREKLGMVKEGERIYVDMD